MMRNFAISPCGKCAVASPEESDVDMRRLRGAVAVGNAARSYCLENTDAVGVGLQASETREVFVGVGAARVDRVLVAALRVRLP